MIGEVGKAQRLDLHHPREGERPTVYEQGLADIVRIRGGAYTKDNWLNVGVPQGQWIRCLPMKPNHEAMNQSKFSHVSSNKIGSCHHHFCGRPDTARDNGWATLSSAGSLIDKNNTSFDARNYGFIKLGELVRKQPYLEVRDTPDPSGVSHLYVRMRGPS